MSGWPAVWTERVPIGRQAAFAFFVGSLVVLVAVPFLAARAMDARGALWPLPVPHVGNGESLPERVVLFLGLLEFSPLLSIFGLMVAVPLTWFLLSVGRAGWLVFTVVFGVGGGALVSRLFVFDPGPNLGSILIGFAASAVLGLSFWLGMKFAAPSLFRSPTTPAEVPP